MSPEQATWFTKTFAHLVEHVTQGFAGHGDAVSLALAAMLSPGHVLVEDIPGTGKTSLAKALAAIVQGTPRRVQFTAEMLPSDITGAGSGEPDDVGRSTLFSHVVLADEINRASPGTQSGLLEAMGEGQITVDGATHVLDTPFLVIATQSPGVHIGTHPLDPALLDRFQVRIRLPDPGHATNVQILHEVLQQPDRRERATVISPRALHEMSHLAATVQVDPVLVGHVCRLMEETRRAPEIALGVSIRGALALVRTARVWAAAQGRHVLVPDDIEHLLLPMWSHRIALQAEAEFSGVCTRTVLERILADVAPPLARQDTP